MGDLFDFGLKGNIFVVIKIRHMGMLIGINEDGRLDGDDWRSVPEFRVLEEVEMRCVVLIWDNQSMYNRMDEVMREERVSRTLLGSGWDRFLRSKKYKEAMWLYRAIDYDIDMVMLELYKTKLVGLMSKLSSLEMSDDVGVQRQYEIVNKNVGEYMKRKNEIEQRIMERGRVNKNFKLMLSGIERFYERAKMMRSEADIFRNKRG